MNYPVLAGVLLVGLLSPQALADQPRVITGHSEVVRDGDTILLGSEGSRRPVRLWGIDAPEFAQQCQDGTGRPYACGQAASMHLYEMIALDRRLTCEVRDTDRYGRTVALCRNSQGDLGARMVAAGWAVDYRRYSGGWYQPQEDAARRAALGLWRGEFNNPSDWRARRR